MGIALLGGGCGVSDDDGGGDDDDDVPHVIDGPPAPTETCGNNECEGAELSTCPGDCPVCSDGICNGSETSASCPGDCPLAPATLVVRNTSTYNIYALYVARCEDPTWGLNRLGTSVLYPSYMLTLTGLTPGCYDFRAEYSSNVYWQRFGTQLEPGGTFTWTLL